MTPDEKQLLIATLDSWESAGWMRVDGSYMNFETFARDYGKMPCKERLLYILNKWIDNGWWNWQSWDDAPPWYMTIGKLTDAGKVAALVAKGVLSASPSSPAASSEKPNPDSPSRTPDGA